MPRASRAQRQRLDSEAYRLIDDARGSSHECVVGGLYAERLDELELDLAILEAWGDAERFVRCALAATARRRAASRLAREGGSVRCSRELARELLRTLAAHGAEPAPRCPP